MVRTPGFGSNPVNLFALFRLAFTMAPPIGLTLLIRLTRWIVLQKARRHGLITSDEASFIRLQVTDNRDLSGCRSQTLTACFLTPAKSLLHDTCIC